MHFDQLGLIDPLLAAVRAEGYDTPTPIQERAIPPALDGRDVLGCAQTGTGKTAAFALPVLQHLAKVSSPSRGPRIIRALVLTPTRELAAQIGESFERYAGRLDLKHAVVFGGVSQVNQVRVLRDSTDILVATPGRLLDLLSQRLVNLSRVEIFVLDEADRMLDMGFIHDVRRVIDVLPREGRQTLFFSATMPPDIQNLANRILVDPVRVEVTPVSTTPEKIRQKVYFVDKLDKRALLDHVLLDESIDRVIVFTRTKHGADRVAKGLERTRVTAAAIHGNKSQNARERALRSFKAGETRVLVATDIAARGIDIDGVSHVINYDLPNVPEAYVHRIGRTARAGASGIAFSFCDAEERPFLADIEKLIRMRVEHVTEHPFPAPPPPARPLPAAPPPRGPRFDSRGPRNDSRGGDNRGPRNDSRGDSRGYAGPSQNHAEPRRDARPQSQTDSRDPGRVWTTPQRPGPVVETRRTSGPRYSST